MSEATPNIKEIKRKEFQADDWSPTKIIYISLMAFNIICFLWLLATGSGIEMPLFIWITRITAAFLAIYLGKLWRDRGFQILFLYSLFFFLRAFISDSNCVFSSDVSESILSALWLFAGCYGLGHVLSTKQTKKFLAICLTVWIIGIVVFAILGIYTAWTEIKIPGINVGFIGLHGYSENGVFIGLSPRLNIIYSATISGSIIAISILISAIFAISTRRKTIRVLYIIAIIPLLFTLALTDSRTAYIIVALGLSCMGFVVFIEKLNQSKRNITIKPWIKYTIAIIITIAFSFLLLYGITLLNPVINAIKTRGIIPTAYAEKPGGALFTSRSFEDTSGRIDLWKDIVNYILSNKRILLFGNSKHLPLSGLSGYYAHCHCLYLQIIVESGILGLLLVCIFIFNILKKSIRIIDQSDASLWIRLLPAIFISLLIGDIAECFLWLRSSQCIMSTILFISAGIISSQGINRKQIN